MELGWAKTKLKGRMSVSDLATGLSKEFQKNRIVIGRIVSADLRLDDMRVSPIHAVIEVSGERKITLYDLASETGTTVNGKRIVSQEIEAGDRIGIAGREFRVDWLLKEDRQHPSGGKSEDTRPLLLIPEEEVDPIFDFSKTDHLALEVVYSWRGMILGVEHYQDKQDVFIGPKASCQFGIPGWLGNAPFNLVRLESEGRAQVTLSPKMKGLIQKTGSVEPFAEGQAGKKVELKPDQLIKASIQDVDFYLRFTSSPPGLNRRALFERDPILMKIIAGSLALTIAFLGAIFRLPVTPQLEVEELSDRVVSLLYQPEKFSPLKRPEIVKNKDKQPEPEKHQQSLPKETVREKLDLEKPQKPLVVPGQKAEVAARSQSQGQEGEGARAKGREGQRGSKRAAPGATAQNQAKRPSPQGGTGAGGAKSEVGGQGNLELLKGATNRIENLLGGATQKLGQSGSKIQGYGGFDTRGQGGLGAAGTGSGGGGEKETLGGLGKKGQGGGRVGTGLGAAGEGSQFVGGKSRVVIRSGTPDETVVMGTIDADAVLAAILRHRDEFKLCYEREINADRPDLAGRVATSFVIGSNGRVVQAGVTQSTLNHGNVEKCVLNVIRRIQFPEPRGGGTVEVNYPFKFSPTGGR